MWKHQHSVKDNPKDGYDWSVTTRQLQTAFCMCQREHWECRRPCAQSGIQSKNAPIDSWDLTWIWHSLTDCAQNNSSRSPAQLCQTTSCAGAVWSQSRRLSDSLQAAAEEVQWYRSRLHMVYGWKSVYRRTTIQLAEWPGLCASWNQEATHRLLRSRLTFNRRRIWFLEVTVTEGVVTKFLRTYYEPVWQILGLKEVMCK